MADVPADAEVEPGTLLVAAPTMVDPNFRRTVVFVIDNRDEGTLGVVLNRPSDVPVYDVLPNWGSHVAEPQSVFVGGPVEKKTALCLAALRTGETASSVPGVIAVRGPVALVDLDTDPEVLVPKVRGVRVFAGYSGWDSGQLANEIERDDWVIVPALPSDVLASPHHDLWGQVLRRQGIPLALLATHPGDLQRN
ncbi:YqgE/AlgH family protein [Amycolatopsis alba]|uniref:YqgE/AlgH family protein n=1 Tax=Amycolatopsis alba TaxID=76020 RepID=UPI00037CDFE8|nr:YqgE/AlgH family protein [Amycolatopsis alba]